MNWDLHNGFRGAVVASPGSSSWPAAFIHIDDIEKRVFRGNPLGDVNIAESPSWGNVRVKGWAFDPNAPESAVNIHVYVGGGPSTPGVRGFNLGPADKARPDVAEDYPEAGPNHGYDRTFGREFGGTIEPGTYPVCVYAINIGAGTHTSLGCPEVTVTEEPSRSAEWPPAGGGGSTPPSGGGGSQDPGSDPEDGPDSSAFSDSVREDDPVLAAVELSGGRFVNAEAFARAERQARWAVLANDRVFADSLAAASLTADGPLLYTSTDRLAEETAAEIDRVLGGQGTVYMLGGTAALDQRIEEELAGGGYDVVRLAGASRVETAVAVAEEVDRLYDVQTVAVARAYGLEDNPTAWADSVTGGAWAATVQAPILVTPTDSLHPAVEAWLRDHDATEVVVLGGTAAVTEAVVDEIGGTRVSGATRFATAVAIARELWGATSGQGRFVVTNGAHVDGWAYGLAAAGTAADADAPLVLVDTGSVPEIAADLVASCGTVELLLVGGDGVLGADLRAQLDELTTTGAC